MVSTWLALGAEVAAGVRQQLEADARQHGALHLLDRHFMIIRQAMGLPKARGSEAARYLHEFVEQMKYTGFIESALQRHGITGVSIAGPAAP